MKKIKALAAFIPTGIGLLAASVVFAQQVKPIPTVATTASDIQQIFCSIIAWFFWVVIVVSVIMVLFAAYDYVTAQDDTEKTTRARKTLTYAAIGIGVALIALGFPRIIASIFPQGGNVSLFSC